VYIGGASLGGGAALDLAHSFPDLFKGIILIDAQAYLEGSPGSSLIWPLDVLGIQVLKAKFLRRFASVQSYYDSEKFATEDAMLVGRLPCLTDGNPSSRRRNRNPRGTCPRKRNTSEELTTPLTSLISE